MFVQKGAISIWTSIANVNTNGEILGASQSSTFSIQCYADETVEIKPEETNQLSKHRACLK